jgi:hypothetical protein
VILRNQRDWGRSRDTRHVIEEIKCFHEDPRRSSLCYQLRQCRPCSGRDQNGSRFRVYGVRPQRACNACITYEASCSRSPLAGCIYSVYRSLLYTSAHWRASSSATLLLAIGWIRDTVQVNRAIHAPCSILDVRSDVLEPRDEHIAR